MKKDSWYDLDGNLAYNPSPEDIRHGKVLARVTSVTSVWPKPFLQEWKDKQMLLAAATTPRPPEMTDDEFVKLVTKESNSVAGKAARGGTAVHDAIATWLTQGKMPDGDKAHLAPVVEAAKPMLAKLVKEIVMSEQVVMSRQGYAGRLDLLAEMPDGDLALIDFKTRDFDKPTGMAWYVEQPMQLAAYAEALKQAGQSPRRYYSVLLPRVGARSPVVRQWEDRDIQHGWTRFSMCLRLYLGAMLAPECPPPTNPELIWS